MNRTHTPLDIQKIQSGWRKRQYDPDAIYERDMRNRTLEEVAKEIEKMTVFGKDTIGSFAVYIREMKS
jgi:hypothetical protein